jgi:hypothetical protein
MDSPARPREYHQHVGSVPSPKKLRGGLLLLGTFCSSIDGSNSFSPGTTREKTEEFSLFANCVF